MKMSKKWLMLCVFTLAATLAAEDAKKEEAKAPAGRPEMPPASVVVEDVTAATLTAPREYIGHIEAASEVTLTARVSGTLLKQNFKDGDLVKEGDLLFEIEDTSYRARAESARALVEQIEAELEFAKSNYERNQSLVEKSIASQATFEEARRLFNLTRGRLTAAKASLLDAENELSYTKIHAPISGRTGKGTYSVGNYVSLASEPLLTIVSVDPMNIKFSISERENQLLSSAGVGSIRSQADITVRLADGKIYKEPYEILLMDNKVDNRTGTISLWASFRNPKFELIPGGYVNVSFSKKDAPTLPSVAVTAVMTDSNGNYVYAVAKDNTVIRRNVKLGELVGGRQLITAGLEVGETVIVAGNNKTMPGGTVVPSRNQ